MEVVEEEEEEEEEEEAAEDGAAGLRLEDDRRGVREVRDIMAACLCTSGIDRHRFPSGAW